MDSSETPYTELSPQTVLDAIEAVGHRCDGRVLALNSYENRVYQIGIEEDQPVVAKFYRPGRWSGRCFGTVYRCMCIEHFAMPSFHAAAGAGRSSGSATIGSG